MITSLDILMVCTPLAFGIAGVLLGKRDGSIILHIGTILISTVILFKLSPAGDRGLIFGPVVLIAGLMILASIFFREDDHL
jgi:hypothetical protein